MSEVNAYNVDIAVTSNPFIANMVNVANQYAEQQKQILAAQQQAMASLPNRLANYSQYTTVTTNYNNPYSNYTNYSYSEKNLSKKGNGYGKEFLDKVKQIAQRLNCDYKDLLGVMNAESGINAKARNKSSSATGLIQFMESTAKSLGTTTAALASMSPVQQLDYVEKYLRNAKQSAGIPSGQRLSAGDLYTLVFMPARANRNVVASAGEAAYAANKGLDKNKDGMITKDELAQKVVSKRVSDNSFLA